MNRETAEYLVEALEFTIIDSLLSSQRDRLRSCLRQVAIDMLADDGGDDS